MRGWIDGPNPPGRFIRVRRRGTMRGMLALQVASLVKERRMLRQLTQAELALLAGVSRAIVVRLERPGLAAVRIDAADRVLRALGVQVEVAPAAALRTRARAGADALH